MTTKSPKLALVYDAIYPYVLGGGEKRFYELGKRLAKSGFEVHFYGMKMWDGPNVIKKQGMYYHGLSKARPLYTKSGRRSIWQAIMFGVSCLKLIKEDFDYIDCCGFPYFSLFACKFVTKIRRKRLYATWHEVWGKSYWKKYLGIAGIVGYWVEKFAVKMPDEFIAVSNHTAGLLSQKFHPKQPINVIENGIDIKSLDIVRISNQKSDVIYVGRLMSYKHVDTVIQAIATVAKINPKVSLHIIGDGPEREKLESLITSLRLQNNVILHGFVADHNKVIGAMKASKVFVLPSSREGFGMVAIEAHAAGLPVVTIDAKSNAAKDLITSQNGIVTKLSAKEIAAAISSLLAKTPSKVIVKKTAEKYDWTKLAANLKELLV